MIDPKIVLKMSNKLHEVETLARHSGGSPEDYISAIAKYLGMFAGMGTPKEEEEQMMKFIVDEVAMGWALVTAMKDHKERGK